MNLRVVGVPTDKTPTNLRVVDLDDLDQAMDAEDRVLGPDGRPSGHFDGTVTALGQADGEDARRA